jgi:hypothetical protein
VPDEKGFMERSMANSSTIFSGQGGGGSRRGGAEEEDHDDGGLDLEVVVVVRIAKRPLVFLV